MGSCRNDSLFSAGERERRMVIVDWEEEPTWRAKLKRPALKAVDRRAEAMVLVVGG